MARFPEYHYCLSNVAVNLANGGTYAQKKLVAVRISVRVDRAFTQQRFVHLRNSRVPYGVLATIMYRVVEP